MPFRAKVFQEEVVRRVPEDVAQPLVDACHALESRKTPQQKARCIQELMTLFDEHVAAPARREIMESCGRQCIGASTLATARKLSREASDLEDLLHRMNEAHVGGGRLELDGTTVRVTYERCYCGSVNKLRGEISPTYCQCSCGWLQRLFETVLDGPVHAELLSSVLLGNDACRFAVRAHGVGEQTPASSQ